MFFMFPAILLSAAPTTIAGIKLFFVSNILFVSYFFRLIHLVEYTPTNLVGYVQFMVRPFLRGLKRYLRLVQPLARL